MSAQGILKGGFWVWDEGPVEGSGEPQDYIYFRAGEVPTKARSWARLPDHMPRANEYWAVYRSEAGQTPALESARFIGEHTAALVRIARIRGIKLVGVQLDIDVATRSLQAYADWLKEVKKQLPPGMQLSVTGLLDWFERGGTGIGEVVAAVDEFVPQFYDLGDDRQRLTNAIAARVDGGKWGPIFNNLHKR